MGVLSISTLFLLATTVLSSKIDNHVSLNRRNNPRPPDFLAGCKDGAKLYLQLKDAIYDPSHTDTDVNVVLHRDDGQEGIGWRVTTYPGEAKNSRRVNVDKPGWTYALLGDGVEGALKGPLSFLRKKGVENIQFQYVEATALKDLTFNSKLYFDCTNGIIAVYSAYFVREGERPPDKERWSDLTRALFEQVCPEILSNLRWVFAMFIDNETTLNRLSEAAYQSGHYVPYQTDLLKKNAEVIMTWKPAELDKSKKDNYYGLDPASGQCDFFSLMYSPNAIGTSYLAKDNVDRLERKTISAVHAFYDLTETIIEHEPDPYDSEPDTGPDYYIYQDTEDGKSKEVRLYWHMVIELESECQ